MSPAASIFLGQGPREFHGAMPIGARGGAAPESKLGTSLCNDTLFFRRGFGPPQGDICNTVLCVCVCRCQYVCVCVGGVSTGPAASEAISAGNLEAPRAIPRLRVPALRFSALLNCLSQPHPLVWSLARVDEER